MSAESLDNLEKETGSVSHWLKGLKTGDRSAVDAIWHRYYQRIVQFAIRKLKVNPDRAVDGEDIAQITMHRFCSCVASGRYPNLDDREQLWALLVVFTINRIRKHLRSCSAPEAPTIMADMVQCWLNRLDLEDPSGELRQIAIWSMEDISGSEIARILKKRKSYVLQQIRLIRLLWEECET
jgi:hypothetical protein